MASQSSCPAEWLVLLVLGICHAVQQLSLMQASAKPGLLPACRRWSRVLLLQQLLTDAVDLLDPTYVRVPRARRTRLMPVQYGPLPALSEYQRKLRVSCYPDNVTACSPEDLQSHQWLELQLSYS